MNNCCCRPSVQKMSKQLSLERAVRSQMLALSSFRREVLVRDGFIPVGQENCARARNVNRLALR